MSSLLTRIISAFIAITIFVTIFYFFQENGLKIIVLFASLAGARELNRVLFAEISNRYYGYLFFAFNFFIFLLSSLRPAYSGLIYAFSMFAFVSSVSQWEEKTVI